MGLAYCATLCSALTVKREDILLAVILPITLPFLLCNRKPRPLLDVNMSRVLERYFGPRSLADIRYDPYLQNLAQRLVACDDSL